MNKLFIFIISMVLVFSCTSCKMMDDLEIFSDQLLLSIIYTIEHDDVDGFIGLFLPSFVKSDGERIKQEFYIIKEYYHGNATEYSYQLTDQVSREPKTITQTQLYSFKPIKASEASINHQYSVKTDIDTYIISFSWIQNKEKNFGLTAIYIHQRGHGISQS